MKRNITLPLLILVSGILMAGCGQMTGGGSSPPASAVAIVDLDKVAARVGRDKKLNQAIKEKETELNEQLESERAALEQQVGQRRSEVGDQPTDTQQAELQAFQQEAARKLLAARQLASNQLQQLRAQLINEFRSEIQPVVLKIASARKISLVLTKNDAMVLAYDPLVDITEAVADGMTDAAKE